MLRLWSIGILVGMALPNISFGPAEAAAVSLETAGQRLDLQGIPSFLASVSGDQFVLGFLHDGATDLALIDRDGDQPAETARLRLGFPLSAGKVDFSGKRLIAVGNKEGKTWVASIELVGGGKVVERILPMMLANPLVAVDATGIARVADRGLGRIYVLDRNLFDDATTQATVTRTLFFDGPGGIDSLHVTAGGQFGFVNDHASARLSIIDADGRVLDSLSSPAASNPVRYTGPATVSFHDGSQGVSAPVSLLIAEYGSETLRIVDFEPVLQALSVTTVTSIALPIKPGSVLEADPVGAVLKSPIVLGASADEGMIVVGNRFSTSVLFFSRAGDVLERIGTATLANAPARILVSETGSSIVFAYADASFVTVVGLRQSTTSMPGYAQLNPGGNAEVREIRTPTS
jgi:hypothetical protein